MSAHGLAHAFLAAEIDLRFGDRDALGRWGDSSGDDRANSLVKSSGISLSHIRLEPVHLVGA
jgi:hypothetical protein